MINFDESVENVLDSIDPDDNFFNGIFNSLNRPHQSEYYTIDQFSLSCSGPSTITVLNFNIRSFNANGDKLMSVLDTIANPPEIIVLTETWLTEANVACSNIEGYESYHTMRAEGRGGGVSIYFREDTSAVKIEQFCFCTITIETCVVKVRLGSGDITVFGLYRPHSDTIDSFSEKLHDILRSDYFVRETVIVAGDFNADLLKSDNVPIINLVSSLQTLHFLPVITKPTRFPADESIGSPSLLDHVWLNTLSRYCSGILCVDITDHCPTFVSLFVPQKNVERIKLSFRCHAPENVQSFLNELMRTDWNITLAADVSQNVEIFIKTVNSLYCKCFPLKVKFIDAKRIHKPWLTTDIFKAIRRKSQMFKHHKLGLISKEQCNAYNNWLTTRIRKSKATYFLNSFASCHNDIRKTWSHIRKILSQSSTRKSVKSLVIDGNEIIDNLEISNKFNEYFTTVALDLDSQLPVSNESPLAYLNANRPNSLFLYPVSLAECSRVIADLKLTRFDVNTIPVKLLIHARDILSAPIIKLVNNSFEAGIFPSILKAGTVTPIFKSGDPADISNYRPISVLPLFSKIFERCMANRLINFANKYSIISPHQFGFQKNKSTVDAIVDLTEYIYGALNGKRHCLSIFIDLKKAFDTVNHAILLQKLEHYGVRGLPLRWFVDYLRDRSQCVKVGSSISTPKTINIGIPQGSILGPLLFLFYINDLPNVSKLSPILFADDTTLSITNVNYSVLIEQTNGELRKVFSWMVANRLSVNVSKTFAILFTKRATDVDRNVNVYFKGEVVNILSRGKFLGVHIDGDLRFNHHINHVCNKLSKSTGILYKLRSFVPAKVMRNLYYNLVYPYLLYCNLVWGSTFNVHLDQLVLLQKKIIRIISSQGYLSHTNVLFREMGILKFNDLHTYVVALYAFKQNSNNSLTTLDHQYFTRNRENPVAPFHRLAVTQHSVSFSAPHVWNDLPLFVKNCTRLETFKMELKKHLLNSYETND